MFVVLALAIVLVGIPRAAAAYVDPGAGSMLLQLVLGGVAGLLVILKLYYRRLVGFLRGRPVDTDSGTGERQDR